MDKEIIPTDQIERGECSEIIIVSGHEIAFGRTDSIEFAIARVNRSVGLKISELLSDGKPRIVGIQITQTPTAQGPLLHVPNIEVKCRASWLVVDGEKCRHCGTPLRYRM